MDHIKRFTQKTNESKKVESKKSRVYKCVFISDLLSGFKIINPDSFKEYIRIFYDRSNHRSDHWQSSQEFLGILNSYFRDYVSNGEDGSELFIGDNFFDGDWDTFIKEGHLKKLELEISKIKSEVEEVDYVLCSE